MNCKSLKTKTEVVKEYLLGDSPATDIRSKYGFCLCSIYHWSDDPDVLSALSQETGESIDRLRFLKERKGRLRSRKYTTEEKVRAVADYIFGDVGYAGIDIDRGTINRWFADSEILARAAINKGMAVEEIQKAFYNKSRKVRYHVDTDVRVEIAKEYLLGDKKVTKIAAEHDIHIGKIHILLQDQSILARVSEAYGMPVDELQTIYRQKRKQKPSHVTKLAVVKDYLIDNLTCGEISDRYDVCTGSVSAWARDDKIIAELAEKTGKTVEDLRTAATEKRTRKYDTKIAAVEAYAVEDLSLKDINQRYGLSGAHIVVKWASKPDLLDVVAKRNRMNIAELEEKIRVRKSARNPNGYWNDWVNLESNLRAEITKEYIDGSGRVIKNAGEFPTHLMLIEFGIKGLAEGIATHGGYLKMRERLGYLPIRGPMTSQNFVNLIESEADARLVIERFGGNDADIADILAVVYEGRLSRDDALRFMEDPSLRRYLGGFQRPSGIGDIFDAGEHLLPYDKNNVIRDIIYRKALEYRNDKLGSMPTPEQRQRFLQEMEVEIGALQ